MREQKITKVVDALAGQSRVVLTLACGHSVSITKTHIEAQGSSWRMPVALVDSVHCLHCPDPTPKQKQQMKPAHQLYKEAGEP